jgi:molybdate transport system regulatory protein
MNADGGANEGEREDEGDGDRAVDAGFDAQLRVGDVAFDARDATLLRTIDDFGSLNRAAEDLGRSYSRALERLEELEGVYGPLVERRRGGREGGGSELTAAARDLLARFDRLCSGYASVAQAEETVLSGVVEERDGELGIVNTEAGRVKAIVPPEGDRVQVAIRSDAVTLNEPGDAPEPDATSARNRFQGIVETVDKGTALARVTIDVGAASPLVVVVTMDSVDRLDLQPGRDVVASFKATATRAVPDVEEDDGSGDESARDASV